LFFCTLAGCAAVEIVFYLWLCLLGHQVFTTFVSSADTFEYDRVARELAAGHLVATKRTLAYPLFLSLGYRAAGENAIYWIVAVQLVLNLSLTALCWKLVEKLAPQAGTSLRVFLTLFCFLAGMGMALYLLSDFLASLCFGAFLYGFLFWRSRRTLVLSALALALATLIRPTFTLIPLLLPALAFLVKHCTSRLPLVHLLVFIVTSLAATGLSIAYQYAYQGYVGPSPIVTQNIQRVLYFATADGKMPFRDHLKAFESEIGGRAGRSYDGLSRTEQEKYAKQIFWEQLMVHPKEIASLSLRTFLNYIFVPVESTIARITDFLERGDSYQRYIRPTLGLACLPIWILSLVPPVGSRSKWSYYLIVLILVLYMAGITALNPRQGERIRFPILAFMLPIVAWNGQACLRYLRKWRQKGNNLTEACM
jgi:hypothetical protein